MLKALENEPIEERWRRPSPSARRPDRHLQIHGGCEATAGRDVLKTAEHLFSSWERIRRQIAIAERVILLSDFDGTLVPLQRHPGDVRMPSSLQRLLRRLAKHGTKIGIISGRAIEDVRRRVGVEGIWYAGSHGYFLRDPRGQAICLLPPKIESQMKALSNFLRWRFRFAPGLEVEPKDGTVAVHYRRAARAERAWAYEALCEVLAGRPNLRLMRGKKVWEILPEGAVNKWKAVQVILDREGFTPGKNLVVYLGDDVTDEAVFRNMRGLSVSIGRASLTAAAFYLESHREVRQFLQRIEGVMKGERVMVGMSQVRRRTND